MSGTFVRNTAWQETSWLPAVLVFLALSSSGCYFGGSRAAVRRQEVASGGTGARDDALERKDFATALAYDDFLLSRDKDDGPTRADRKTHFARMLEARLAKLGPLRDDNAEAIFGTLLAFRQEARRDLSARSGAQPTLAPLDVRQQDLAAVEAAQIAPQLVVVAAQLWKAIDAAAAAGEAARVIPLALGLIDALAPDKSYAPRLAQFEERVAADHLALAQQAGDPLPGARVLHARLAAIHGAQIGALGELGPALIAETTQNWSITSTGNCGDTVTGHGTVDLAARLRTQGFAAGTGQPMSMTVTFDNCPVSKREFQTEDKVSFQEKSIVAERVDRTHEVCSQGLTFKESKRVGYYNQVTTTKVGGNCWQEPTGEFDMVKREKIVNDVERIQVNHRVHRMSATGLVRMTFAGGTREERFTLDAESDDDVSWTSKHRPSKSGSGKTEAQVRDRLHEKLLQQMLGLKRQVLAVGEAVYLSKAQASAAQGQALEADNAFFIANQIVQAGSANPLFSRWMDTKYHMPAAVLTAAIAGQALPSRDLIASHVVTLPAIAKSLKNDDLQLRGALLFSLTAGPSSVSTTGGSQTLRGGIAAFAFSYFDGGGGGFRMQGGIDQKGKGLVDIDFLGGYGFWWGGLQLSGIAGFGGDFTPSNDDFLAPTANSFMVPPSFYVEYGGRASYGFGDFGALEAIYTKAFRATSALPRENRGDVRLTLSAFAITLRYAEYLAHGDGFVTPFTTADRLASAVWVLGGIGY